MSVSLINLKRISFIILGLITFSASTGIVQSQNIPIVDSLKKELMMSAPDTQRVNILNEIGGYLLKLGNYDEAPPYLFAARELAEKLSYTDGLAVCLNRIAIMYMDKNDYEKSTSYYLQALEIRKKMGDVHGIADIISNMGIIYSEQGEYEKALNCYMISLRIREATHDGYGIATSLDLIANIHYLQGNFKKALKYYFQTLNIQQVKSDPYFKGLIVSNIGMTYVNLNNYEQAFKYFTLALQLDEEIGDKEGIANSYSNLGELQSKKGHLEEALVYYQKGLAIFEEMGSKKGISESYSVIGKTYSLLGKNEKALDFFHKQLELATEIKSKENMSKAHYLMAEQYKKMNDYKSALENYQLYTQIEAQIHRESITETLNELEIKYNNQKKEIEIETLKSEKFEREIRYQHQQQFYYFIIAILIFLFLILLYIFNRRRLRKKQMLERKNFEIQLKALSEQMNPHFIFNSLNSIMEFIRVSEKDLALKYLTKFSRLIRLVLESSGKKSIPLSHEIELLKLYMDLENLRFGGIFSYDIQMDEKMDIHSIEIPPLIIQPFIENSILHGIQNRTKYHPPKNYEGKIQISMTHKGHFLLCMITDNGIGRKKALEIKNEKLLNHQSLGMRITNDRLSMLSQNKCTVEFDDLMDKNEEALGTRVKILIPLIDPFE